MADIHGPLLEIPELCVGLSMKLAHELKLCTVQRLILGVNRVL